MFLHSVYSNETKVHILVNFILVHIVVQDLNKF